MASDSDGGDFAKSFRSYVNEDAKLPFKVDFLGMFADFLKSIWFLAVTIGVGATLAFGRAVDKMWNSAFEGLQWIITTTLSLPEIYAQEAERAAVEQIEVFGLFALPASVLTIGVSAILVGFVIYLVVGE